MLKKSLFILLTFSSSLTFAQNRIDKLSASFDNLLADSQTKHAITSLCVLDAKTGKTLYAKNEEIGLATASTLKNITAATAFYILGEDFKYETKLAYSGSISADGTLKGDLIIIGSGDPTLGSARYSNTETAVLNQWVTAIKNAGIKKIEGKIIGDDSVFGTQTTPEGWVWQDIGNYYGAGTSGLAWRENQFDVVLKPGGFVGDNAKLLTTKPEMPYLKLVNELKTGANGTGDRAYAFLPPYANVGYIRGTWGLGISKTGISLSQPDPAFDCAYRLQDTLKRLGINTLTASVTTTRLMALANETIPTERKTISTISSPPLKDMVYWFLKKSINLYGESLLKSMAIKNNSVATTAKGAETEINFWSDKGIDKTALNIIDGSGLSPGNRITSNAMAQVLYQIQKENWFNDFYNGLPEYNGMKIKSGSINDVSAFAGYHTDKEGNKYVIVININNYSGNGINKKLFKVLDELK